MNSFLDPLDEPQQLLVDTVWEKFAEVQKFPSFRYIEFVMRRAGYNAEVVLSSFPVLSEGNIEYRAANANFPRPLEGPVWLTLAGLRHVQDPRAAKITSTLLDYMRAMTKAQEWVLRDPFTYAGPGPKLELRKTVMAEQPDADHGLTPWVALARVANYEWPGMRFNYAEGGNGNGRLGLLPDADFDTVEDYLAAVVAALTPADHPAELTYTDPRALVRSIGFFDVTCELVIGRPLVKRPPLDRSGLLVLDVATEDEFLAGLAALAELLGQLDIPKRNPPHALGRITDHLKEVLPGIDRAAVERAVHTLDQIRVLRNSNIHTKPGASLLEAYQSLGLAFPVRDYGTAWDSIRAYADRAFASLQEQILAARPASTGTQTPGVPAAEAPSAVVPAQKPTV
ncbi:hypothetical protein OG689_41200 [Kitasatospora sp. NBC_00240]|uniref:hypothetical protein n=1 Tax=Kitasatospora sp. NBC_00240 TaxID=2903567 RepID=UPI0022537D94|nr:hypothetical protein [Kitasatospora sp. NBC_00240]MCX5215574.1 hypothetical protein [Kitasatospora sp. NBC_00240]